MGNLAGNRRYWYFWGPAGIRTEDVINVMPGMHHRLRRQNAADFEIVVAGSGNKKLPQKLVVAVPLLNIVEGTHGPRRRRISPSQCPRRESDCGTDRAMRPCTVGLQTTGISQHPPVNEVGAARNVSSSVGS
jgi:hypothetical protein